LESLGKYFGANGFELVTCRMLERIIPRFQAAGLLPDRPAPAPAPAPVAAPVWTAQPDSKPTSIKGWNVVDGEPTTYTTRQLERLSAEDYRRALHIHTAAIVQPHRF